MNRESTANRGVSRATELFGITVIIIQSIESLFPAQVVRLSFEFLIACPADTARHATLYQCKWQWSLRFEASKHRHPFCQLLTEHRRLSHQTRPEQHTHPTRITRRTSTESNQHNNFSLLIHQTTTNHVDRQLVYVFLCAGSLGGDVDGLTRAMNI